MDDLLREFVTETNESLDVVDIELVRFEQDPNNAKILANIFRLVHTIKGTCGFLALPRLEALAHAAEALMGKFRDGAPATSEAVTLILATIDRIKEILQSLEDDQREPDGSDDDLIAELDSMSQRIAPRPAEPTQVVGTLTTQVLERPLRPGEDSLDDLERAFRETAVEPIPAKPQKADKPSASDGASIDDDNGKSGTQSIRVTVETLEQLMTMVSELVLTRNQLLEIVRRHEESEFKAPLQRLSNVTAELQEGVMKTRMQPIGNAWQKLPRIVRDLCGELDKQIDLEMQGAETELDRQVLDLIKDPLTHMVRNSADHGLEHPHERRIAGKPERGCIRLSAYHEGGFIVIQVADDGRGLDTERIKAKAIAQGLATETDIEKLSDAQIHKFIFVPGFSTAAQVTSVSGRGVGMDVVRNNIDLIGGTIDVKSVSGVGLSFTIKIPLTLAIIAALIVQAGGEHFAIPQLAVVELVRARAGSDHRIERIRDTAVLRLRDKLLPLARLSDLLGMDGAAEGDADSGYVVVIQVGSQMFGVVVDRVFHTEEIVVKPMSSKLRHIAMFSGNTILGDGSVIMIVDPNGVAQALGSTVSSQMAAANASQESTDTAADRATSLLVFRAGSAQAKAVPLALITRLEEIDARTIELSNGRYMVQYRGQLMPLVTLNETVRVKSEGGQPLLVFSDGTRSMALVVDEIVDIVDDRLDIQVASDNPGVLGSAIVKGQATEIIDIGHFLPLAFEDWFRRKEQPVRAALPSVLLVDDSPFFRNMLTPVLQAAGYAVTAVGSAKAALDLIKDGSVFDVAITDVEMPEIDGFEFAEALRADPRTAELPVIALSSAVS
ncbi:MAG TPA: hybrid sensor histidine kinase/response regulator, partial [Bradyrhizobium sp.]